jgi:hypothetical protein
MLYIPPTGNRKERWDVVIIMCRKERHQKEQTGLELLGMTKSSPPNQDYRNLPDPSICTSSIVMSSDE